MDTTSSSKSSFEGIDLLAIFSNRVLSPVAIARTAQPGCIIIREHRGRRSFARANMSLQQTAHQYTRHSFMLFSIIFLFSSVFPPTLTGL